MSGRVLVVTGSYAPAMIADMHRARQLAWELPARGWDVEVLTAGTDFQHSSILDPDGGAFFAPAIPVHAVRERFAAAHRLLGLGSIGWRALVPMYHEGMRLLRTRRFDLVYVSTTQFPLLMLGAAWKRRTGVPYVLDVHDPCYKPRVGDAPWAHRGAKHAVSAWLAKTIESVSVRAADGLVAVSDDYIARLRERYARFGPAWLEESRHATIPFAASQRDLAQAGAGPTGEKSAQPARIAYVGAGAPVMARAVELFCGALARVRERHPELAGAVRFELRGTTYRWRDGDPRPIQEIARRHGLDDRVREEPARVSYRESVAISLDAAGLLVLGVDDRGYMPSKLFSYAATGRPLLGVLRRDGPAYRWLSGACPGGHALWFEDDAQMPLDDASRELEAFLREAADGRTFDRSAQLAPFDAGVMADRHAVLFDACRP
jgi:hypothetical protein